MDKETGKFRANEATFSFYDCRGDAIKLAEHECSPKMLGQLKHTQTVAF